MDIKKMKVGDLGKLSKTMKASAKGQSNSAVIKKASKQSAMLKKSVRNLQKLEREDPNF